MEHSKYWKGSFHNQKEYKPIPQEILDEKVVVKGLREGLKMYRHEYVGKRDYDLVFNPDEYRILKQKVQDYKKKDSDYYRLLVREYQEMKDLKDFHEIDIKEKEVLSLVDDVEHQKAKTEHQRIFKKAKRKKTTALERKQMKEEKYGKTSN